MTNLSVIYLSMLTVARKHDFITEMRASLSETVLGVPLSDNGVVVEGSPAA